MFTIKIIKHHERNAWFNNYKIGSIIEVDNANFKYFQNYFKIINMFKYESNPKICKCCKQIIRNTKKVYLFGKPCKLSDNQ